MNYLRGTVAVVGTLLAVVVGVMAINPALAAAIPVDTAVEILGNDYLFIAVFGILALLLTVAVIGGRAVSGLNQATPPRPETVQPSPRFGSDFEKTVENEVGPTSYLFSDRREHLRDRLRESAIQATIEDTGCSRSDAHERVENGTWTDDPDAGAFLSPDRSPPVGSRVAAALHGNAWFQRGARRTAQEVVRTAGGGNR